MPTIAEFQTHKFLTATAPISDFTCTLQPPNPQIMELDSIHMLLIKSNG